MVKSALLSLPLLAAAAFALVPVDKASVSRLKRDASSNYTDIDILQYALTLEHLEATFYAQALSNYSLSDFQSAGFDNVTREAVSLLADQEAEHVTLLTSALSSVGATPVSACNYSFGVTDVKGFLQLSSVLESVGVSAYLGAAPYISNKAYLTVAAAITTVEARHQAVIAYFDGQDPFPSPFDTAATFRQVITLAGAFITSCPDGSAPTIQGFPPLKMSGNATAGNSVQLTAANSTASNSTTLYCAFTSGINATVFTTYNMSNTSCMIPSGLVGQTYVVLTNSNSTLTDDNTVAGPAPLALGAGAAYANIVDSPQVTGTAVPTGTGNGGIATTTPKSAAGRSTASAGAILAALLLAIVFA